MRTRGSGGQSLVELALIVPVLLVLFVGIADLGRVFFVGISVEATARNAAETAANRYLAAPPGPLDAPAPGTDASYYADLHAAAASVVCAELRSLPNTNFDAGTGTCPDMPLVMVCVRDGADPYCTTKASPGTAAIPAACTSFTPPPSSSQLTNPDGTESRWVEVRVCYRFTSLLAVPFFSFGEIWVQRTRSFVIPCWFALAGAACG